MKSYLHLPDLPERIKTLSDDELLVLAHEIRCFLVEQVSKTGGHLGSNLGVVELTIALHSVYNSPRDVLIFDVGHQSYVHKMLTGRLDRFGTLRQYGGLSGFPKRAESSHDPFDTGHSSTSISAALGYAIALRQRAPSAKESPSVVCVIGDGALTGGMAFEALNHLGASKEKVTVVLNDNQMSISRNVGGVVGALRTNPGYENLKKSTRSMLVRLPLIGHGLVDVISRLKGGVKAAVIKHGVFFEELGLTYMGPIDGHDIRGLRHHLELAKKVNGPVILHVHTVKGKGYGYAEERPDLYHGVGKFAPEEAIVRKEGTDFSAVFGARLTEMADRDSRIHAISAAMIEGTGLSGFSERHPDRTHDVAIAEQHAVTLGAAMALSGLRPYVAIYSTFLQRAFDQIVHDVCIQKAEVVLCVDRAGLVGNDGETHHGYFDVGYLSMLPNMTVLTAASREDLEEMLEYSIEHRGGPLAIRYPRGTALTDVQLGLEHPSRERFDFSPKRVIGGGSEAVVVTSGKMTPVVCETSRRYWGGGLSVIQMRQIAPIDGEALGALIPEGAAVIVVEDHMEKGGLGDRIRAVLPERTVYSIGYRDFVPHGETEKLMEVLGMDVDGLEPRIRELISRHRQRGEQSR